MVPLSNLETDVLIGILFFLFYVAARSGARNHFIFGIIIGIVFVYSGTVIQGIDGEILTLIGILLILVTMVSQERGKND